MAAKGTVAVFLLAVLLTAASLAVFAQDDSSISKKLDDIEASQKEIMASLAVIKEELQIVKIRVTQQQ